MHVEWIVGVLVTVSGVAGQELAVGDCQLAAEVERVAADVRRRVPSHTGACCRGTQMRAETGPRTAIGTGTLGRHWARCCGCHGERRADNGRYRADERD